MLPARLQDNVIALMHFITSVVGFVQQSWISTGLKSPDQFWALLVLAVAVVVFSSLFCYVCKVKSKVFPYSLPSVGPGADPGVQALSPQVT